MFKKLLELDTERNIKQAIGFYIACYLALFFVGIVASILAVIFGATKEQMTLTLAPMMRMFSTVVLMGLAYKILKKKRQTTFRNMLIVGLVALGGLTIGSALSLLPISYLTTVPDLTKSKGGASGFQQ